MNSLTVREKKTFIPNAQEVFNFTTYFKSGKSGTYRNTETFKCKLCLII